MARSYKSALPTWSTYTPHVGPMGIQPAVNQANIWHNRARQYTPSNIHGELNRSMLGIQSMVKGTGAGLHAAQLIAHTPIIDAMGGYVNQRRASQRDWAAHTRAALEHQDTDINLAGQEVDTTEPTGEPRTAPDSVNPSDVQTQEAARGAMETVVPQVLGSDMGGSKINFASRLNARFNPFNSR